MFKNRFAFIFISIFGLSYLFAGCAIRPQVDFYLSPVETAEGQEIDKKTGSVTVENEGVRITVSALDILDLLKVTSDARVNPYIYINDWGVAKPLYTVFEVTIKNNRESNVSIDPSSAVLLDEEGEQYDAIPYEAFKERYAAYPGLERDIIYYQSPPPYRYRWWHPWYYHYDRYWWRSRPYSAWRVYDDSYIKRSVAKATLLKSAKLYSGGKKQGFLVFPKLKPDSGELKIIIPGVTVFHRDRERRLEFRFHFKQLPAVKD